VTDSVSKLESNGCLRSLFRFSYLFSLYYGWCNIIVLCVHAPSEDKSDDSEDSFYEELEQVFIIILSII
jgi:hypothetical protein